MNDLVERLRDRDHEGQLRGSIVQQEAADEIERLRALLRMVSANLHHPELGGISQDQLLAIDEALNHD